MEMTQHERLNTIERFTKDLMEGVLEAAVLMNEDPERARQTLRAIYLDLLCLTELWSDFTAEPPD